MFFQANVSFLLGISKNQPTSNSCNFVPTDLIYKFLVPTLCRVSSSKWNARKWHLQPVIFNYTHPSGTKREANFRKVSETNIFMKNYDFHIFFSIFIQYWWFSEIFKVYRGFPMGFEIFHWTFCWKKHSPGRKTNENISENSFGHPGMMQEPCAATRSPPESPRSWKSWIWTPYPKKTQKHQLKKNTLVWMYSVYWCVLGMFLTL